MNPALPPEARADLVLRQMTMAEKLSLLRSRVGPEDGRAVTGFVPGIPRLGIPPLLETNAGLGVASAVEDGVDSRATPLPAAIAVASSWDPKIAYAGGAMIGEEARARGSTCCWPAASDLTREPRNGRNFEYLGEDPLLAGVLAGEIDPRHPGPARDVHRQAFRAQRAGDRARHARAPDRPEGALRESDLLAFEIAIERGDPGAVMCAYNQVDGDLCLRGRDSAEQGAEAGLGLSRLGDVGLGRGAQHGQAALAGLDQESGTSRDAEPYFGAASNTPWSTAGSRRRGSTTWCGASCERCSPRGSSTIRRPPPRSTSTATRRSPATSRSRASSC